MSPQNVQFKAYECSAETKHSLSVEEEDSRVDYEMLPGLIHCRPVALIAVKVNKLYTKALISASLQASACCLQYT